MQYKTTGKFLHKTGYLLILAIGFGLACGSPMQAAPAKAAKPSPPQREGKQDPTEWEKVIDAAKKEGSVMVKMRSSFTSKSMERLEKEIKERFGLDLKIQYSPISSMSRSLADALMEKKAGVPPSFDLMSFSTHVVEGMKSEVLERVDWKPLITEDTNPEVIISHPAFRGAITFFTSYQGLMYNSQKVPADKAPKTLRELADPKWKGKIGINRGPDAWRRWAFILGKDKVYSELRAILKNGAIQGQFSDLQSRYLLGEISMALTIASYKEEAIEKGVPTKWQCIEFGDVENFSLTVRKGAKHPNAAKVLAVYLASPQGAKFTLEESNAGNLFYPGNYENDIRMQNKKQGIRDIFIDRNPQLIDFYTGKDSENWSKELQLIILSWRRPSKTETAK
ncbi:MAG: extracellular solute-binding protein [Syntrophales bacterium LBB04]|nr:extracellular solute-binding protein [Syntrophales bacterium LBB04]